MPRGQITHITRDALGRPTEIRYAADHVAFFRYDAAGDVTRIDDRSGSTSYERDEHGRITTKTQAVNDSPANPSQYRIGYGYAHGQLSAISYPSGLQLFYRRTNGRITGIDVQPPSGQLAPFVSELTHTALGQPRSWNWSNGDTAARTFDADGRMTANEFASYIYDAAGRITGISQKLWTQSGGGKNETFTPTTLTGTVGYDSRNRVIRFERPGARTQYAYDPNSNRLTAVDSVTSELDLEGDLHGSGLTRTTSQALNVQAQSNRLLGLTQTTTRTKDGKTLSTAGATVNYGIDANGSLTSDGLRSFEYDAANRLSRVRIVQDYEAMDIRYLHNALGQRVFKGEPTPEQTEPNPEFLGEGFVAWLKRQFGEMFTQTQASTSIGMAYVYGDGEVPSWALLGEYDNGSAKGKGRTEYIWLPLEDGSAVPVGFYRNGKLYAVHTDHLGTPRLVTDDERRPVWQWPYSAFGDNKPTGALKKTHNPKKAVTNEPELLRATEPIEFGLRFPGQIDDPEAGAFYNYFRDYQAAQGRYTQVDPIGLGGGLNRFAYAESSPLTLIDPMGLMGGSGSGAAHRRPPPTMAAFGCMGIACITGGMHNSNPQMSLELTFGGGIEICDAPKPPPPEQTCKPGDPNVQWQPPGPPMGARFGPFIAPSLKRDGTFCLRLGAFYSPPIPLPSLELGDLK